jgi:hypothetical protein
MHHVSFSSFSTPLQLSPLRSPTHSPGRLQTLPSLRSNTTQKLFSSLQQRYSRHSQHPSQEMKATKPRGVLETDNGARGKKLWLREVCTLFSFELDWLKYELLFEEESEFQRKIVVNFCPIFFIL